MLRQFLIVGLVTCAGGEASGKAAQHVPAGTWTVDYAKDYCVLSREGLAGEPGVAFRTRPLALEQDFLVYLPRQGNRDLSGEGQVLVQDDDVATSRWTWIEEPKGQPFRLAHTVISSDQLSRALIAGSVRMRVPDKFDMRVSLPNATKAKVALRACEDDLARRWGVDPTELRSWSKPAASKGDLRSLFWNNKDWASVAMIQSGATRTVLDIDESGKMIGCTIVQRSRVAWVDRQFCETIRKGATFEPALDAHGKAVRGKVVTPAISSVRLR